MLKRLPGILPLISFLFANLVNIQVWAEAKCRSQANNFALAEAVKKAKKEHKKTSLVKIGNNSVYVMPTSTETESVAVEEDYEIEVNMDKENVACFSVKVNKTNCKKIKVTSISCDE